MAKNQCIDQIPNNSAILNDHQAEFPDHSIHELSSGDCAGLLSKLPPTYNGYVEVADHDLVGATMIQDVWEVPPVPTTVSQQIIYLFDATESYPNVGSPTWIVQPVLTGGCYQQNLAGWCTIGCWCWWIASWVVVGGNLKTITPTFNVTPGDTIEGQVFRQATDSNCNGGAGYEIYAIDYSVGNTLEHTTYCTSDIGYDLIPAALEVYSLDVCGNLPAALSEVFSSISSTPTETAWYGGLNIPSNATPQCGYNVTQPASTISLNFLGTSGGGSGGCSPTRGNTPNPC